MRRVLILLVGMLFAWSAVGLAADRYVHGDQGDDLKGANDCLQPSIPCKTITQAITKAKAGDTIKVFPATYGSGEKFPITIDKQLTIVAVDPDRTKTIIDAGKPCAMIIVGKEAKEDDIAKLKGECSIPEDKKISNQADNSIIQGFTIQGSTLAGILVDGASSVQLRGNRIDLSSGTGTGIVLRDSNESKIFDNIIIGKRDDRTNDGIRIEGGSRHKLLGNRVANNGKIGIFLFEVGNENQLSKNTAKNNRFGIVLLLKDSLNTKLQSNIAIDNEFIGIALGCRGVCKDSEMLNNEVSGTQRRSGIFLVGVFQDTTLKENVAERNARAGIELRLKVDSKNFEATANIASNCETGISAELELASKITLSGNVASDNKRTDPIDADLVTFQANEKHAENIQKAAEGQPAIYDPGEFIYRASGDKVAVGDTRLTDIVIIEDAQVVFEAKAGSVVAAGDKDLGMQLAAFANNEKHVDPNGNKAYDPKEFIYLDQGKGNANKVGIGDKRLTAVGACPAGSELKEEGGIGISFKGSNSTLSGNTVNSNGKAGIELSGSGNMLSENTAEGNPIGISLSKSSEKNTLSRNLVRINETGISLTDSNENTLIKNTVSSNRRRGILVSAGKNNVIRDNIISQNGNDETCRNEQLGLVGVGIMVTNGSAANHFLRNLIQENLNGISLGSDPRDQNPQGNVQGNEFRCNSIINNEKHGVQVIDHSGNTIGNSFNKNNIWGNLGFGLRNFQDAIKIDATYNWWGSREGPSTSDRQTSGDRILGPADYVPWLQNPMDIRTCS